MLITFKISNFLSFNEQVTFMMQAGLVRESMHHVIKGKGRNDVDILKSAVIYGANASGKSNFIKAVEFANKFEATLHLVMINTPNDFKSSSESARFVSNNATS